MGKSCFVVCPIGGSDSPERKRSDQVLKYVIAPIVKELGFDDPVRADRISEPGSITDQVMSHLIDDDLIIADLTGLNPNVMYELAIRHAFGKPYVQMCDDNTELPFDVTTERTIFFSHRDLDSVADAKEKLFGAIQELMAHPNNVVGPIRTRVNLSEMKPDGDTQDSMLASLMSMVNDLAHDVRKLSRQLNPPSKSGNLVVHNKNSSLLDALAAAVQSQVVPSKSVGIKNPVSDDNK